MDTSSLSASGFSLIHKTSSGDVDVTGGTSFAWGVSNGVSTLTFSFSGSLSAGYYRLFITDPLNDVAGNTAHQMQQFYEFYKAAPADINLDGLVNGDDLQFILNNWGQNITGRANGDLNGDGTVDGDDMQFVLNDWGTDLTY